MKLRDIREARYAGDQTAIRLINGAEPLACTVGEFPKEDYIDIIKHISQTYDIQPSGGHDKTFWHLPENEIKTLVTFERKKKKCVLSVCKYTGLFPGGPELKKRLPLIQKTFS